VAGAAEAAVDDELRRHAHVLQTLVELAL